MTSSKQKSEERDKSDEEPDENKKGKGKQLLDGSQPIRGRRREHGWPSLAGTQQYSVFISPKTEMSGGAADWQGCLRRGNVAWPGVVTSWPEHRTSQGPKESLTHLPLGNRPGI